MRGSAIVGLTLLCLASTGCATRPTQSPVELHWQELARKDLAAARDVIRSAHPGVIDDQNPGFNAWVESGYEQALALVPQVSDYDTMLSAVRYYEVGFRDGHLGYSDDTRAKDARMRVTGWRTGLVHGRLLVTATADEWPVALPPVGAELLGCDGRTPDAILRDDVAPFVTRLEGDAADNGRAGELWTLKLDDKALRRCRFRTPEGKSLELKVRYRPMAWDQFFAIVMRDGGVHSEDDRHNSYQLRDGVLWVHAGRFRIRPDGSDAAELDAVLAGISGASGFDRIVFDMRGNGGGSSGVGERIFEAATGGLEYDESDLERLPKIYAQWRVSDVAFAALDRWLERDTKLYGADSPQAQEAREFGAAARAAKAAGEPWMRQDAGYRLTREEIARRHGKLRRFEGTIVLLTDRQCVSACLDFADLVRQVPGSIHVGQTTGADAVYIDIGQTALPSGNHLFLPLKVWRNRLRGNNEPYVPDVELDVDMADDAAVRRAVLAALDSHTAHRASP